MYLEENGIDWRLNVVMEDTATSPVIALEKLSALKAKDISAVVGTYSSAELSNVMAYARNNNMLLISYGSVASSLALSGDKVFRFVRGWCIILMCPNMHISRHAFTGGVGCKRVGLSGALRASRATVGRYRYI